MRRLFIAIILVLAVLTGCAPQADENFPVTWRQKDDEIFLYVYLTRDAALELISLLSVPLTFDEVSQFMVENSGGRIPFWEGAMASAALVASQEEARAEMEYRLTAEGAAIEIIGFKENPVNIMEHVIDFPDPPKYLADFEGEKHREIVNTMLDVMKGHSFVVQINGR